MTKRFRRHHPNRKSCRCRCQGCSNWFNWKGNRTDERPAVPLLKLELSIKKDGDALSALADSDWNILGSLFLEMAPINIDIEKVKEMFTPAKNAFMHCSNELDNYIQEQFKGALEDEKERIRRKSCWFREFNHLYGM